MEGLSLYDLAAAQARRTHPHTLVAVRRLGVHRAQIDVPAPLGDVVGVTDVISRARPFAANFANLCHCLLQKIPEVRGQTLIIPGGHQIRQPATHAKVASVTHKKILAIHVTISQFGHTIPTRLCWGEKRARPTSHPTSRPDSNRIQQQNNAADWLCQRPPFRSIRPRLIAFTPAQSVQTREKWAMASQCGSCVRSSRLGLFRSPVLLLALRPARKTLASIRRMSLPAPVPKFRRTSRRARRCNRGRCGLTSISCSSRSP